MAVFNRIIPQCCWISNRYIHTSNETFLKLFVIEYKSNVAIAEIDVFILNVLISIVILLYTSIIIDSDLVHYSIMCIHIALFHPVLFNSHDKAVSCSFSYFTSRTNFSEIIYDTRIFVFR